MLCCAPANRPAAEPLDRSAVANFELARSHRIAIDLAGVGDGASEHAGSQPPGSFEAETGCALEGTVAHMLPRLRPSLAPSRLRSDTIERRPPCE